VGEEVEMIRSISRGVVGLMSLYSTEYRARHGIWWLMALSNNMHSMTQRACVVNCTCPISARSRA